MHESIEATTVLFKKLGLLDMVREIDHDETFLGCGRQSEQLDRDLLLNNGVLVVRTDELTNFIEEGMLEVWVVACLIRTVVQKLGNRDNGHSQVNGEPLSKLVQEYIRRAEECDLRVARPSLDEATSEVALVDTLDLLEDSVHYYNFSILIINAFVRQLLYIRFMRKSY